MFKKSFYGRNLTMDRTGRDARVVQLNNPFANGFMPDLGECRNARRFKKGEKLLQVALISHHRVAGAAFFMLQIL
jgi:hypothetical protein